MLDRAQERTDYIVSFITDISAEQLETGSAADLTKVLKGFEHFSRISYLRVSDTKGKILYRMAHPGIRVDDRVPDADILSSPDDIYDIERDIILNGKHLGVIQLGMSTERIKELLETLMWRGIFVGFFFLSLLTAGIWFITIKLGRDLDTLGTLAGNINSEILPPAPQLDSPDDIGKVASVIYEMHARLRAEEKRRIEAETKKDDFFAMTIHDLKQPLTSLKAALGILLPEEERKNCGEKQIHSLSAVANASLKALTTMVVDVLNLAKLNSRDYLPEKERIPLAGFMRECADENSLSVKAAGKEWSFSLPENIGDAWIFGDNDLIKRVVGNLVLNAIQYTPEGGTIKLGLRLVSRNKAAIYVSDEGEGIPDNFREEIFQKYQGMGKSPKNIGLGLAFCKMVAESHSGTIEVKSEAGKGTEMGLVIPVSVGSAGKISDR